MDIAKTAQRALHKVDEGRALTATAIGKLETADLTTSPTFMYELERALGTIEEARQTLHAIMVLACAQLDLAAMAAVEAR
jgi:hypothetical protein